MKQLIPPESDKPAHTSEKNTEQWGEDDVIDDEGDNEGVELVSSGLTQEEGTDDAPPKGAFANDDEYGGKVVVSPGLTQEEGTDDAPPKGAFATDDEDGAKEDKSGEIVVPARYFKKDD